MYWMFLPLRRYAVFTGRSRRLEYWMFTLGNAIVMLALFALLVRFGVFAASKAGAVTPVAAMSPIGRATGAAFVFYLAAIAVPVIAVQVRRLHDQGRSGWLLLLTFLPYVGTPILLLLMLRGGVRGPNRYGEDPTDPHATAATTGAERLPRRPKLG